MILLRIWNVFVSGTVAVLLYRDMKKTQKIKEIEEKLHELIREKEMEKLRLELPDDYKEDSVDETTGEENPNLIYEGESTRMQPLAASAEASADASAEAAAEARAAAPEEPEEPEEAQAEPENTHSSETSSDGWKEVKSEEEPDEMKLSPSISQEDLVPIED